MKMLNPSSLLQIPSCLIDKGLSLREAFKKKYYLDREIVPIPSDPPTIETFSEYIGKLLMVVRSVRNCHRGRDGVGWSVFAAR